jgi:hypothetical protein
LTLPSVADTNNPQCRRSQALNARQKENFNFQTISAVLADYGYATIRLSDDWQGADLIAQDMSGELLRVQLKSRLTSSTAYRGKDLFIAFGDGENWFLYPHDELLARLLATSNVGTTRSWKESGGYAFPRLSKVLRQLLAPYQLSGDTRPLAE